MELSEITVAVAFESKRKSAEPENSIRYHDGLGTRPVDQAKTKLTVVRLGTAPISG
jgi:hypothetical protein